MAIAQRRRAMTKAKTTAATATPRAKKTASKKSGGNEAVSRATLLKVARKLPRQGKAGAKG